jgi:ketosteroid isomerase-like protein
MQSSTQRRLRLLRAAVWQRAATSALAATVLTLGCRPQAASFTDSERAVVEAEIRAARDAYFEAATSLDADALADFLDPNVIHLSNSDVAPLTTEELREAWRPLSHIEMDVTSDHVVALCKDAGYTIMTASYVVFDTAGTAVESNDWAGTHIWLRTADGWKVQAVHEGRPVRN